MTEIIRLKISVIITYLLTYFALIITSAIFFSILSVSQILSSIVFLAPFGLPSPIFDLHRTYWALACCLF